MIAAIIRGSVRWRNLVLVVAAVLSVLGFYAVRTTPVDALPDLSDVQVIIRTNYPGQAPQIVENQVTYPIASTMLSVPGVRASCAAIRSPATALSTCCLTTAPTFIGRAAAFLSI
jgi:Cu(I)/Ag(I) efflux system membrane protein CusA/SilA